MDEFNLTVGVSYATDMNVALSAIDEILRANPRVLRDPAPATCLVRFADSGIDLELGVWIADPEAGQLNLRSDINLVIWEGFKREGIEIPYPQREVRLLGATESPAKAI